MYSKYLYDLSRWLLATAFGFIGYFLARHLNIGVSIWGNSVGGYCGDKPYRDNEAKKWFRKYWPCFWWSVIRNPANNLARSFVTRGVVTHLTTGILTTATLSFPLGNEQKVFLFYTPNWPIMFKIGYKVWPDSTKLGDSIAPKLAFSIQKGKRK